MISEIIFNSTIFLQTPAGPHFFQSERLLKMEMKDLDFETQWHSSLFFIKLANQGLLEIDLARKVFRNNVGEERRGSSEASF